MHSRVLVAVLLSGAVLGGCGGTAIEQPRAEPAPIPPPASGAVAPLAPTEPGRLTPLARRTAGPVVLRTYRGADGSAGGYGSYGPGCDRFSDSCPPAWCDVSGVVLTELSTEAIAVTVRSSDIGVGPGSRMSLLDVMGPDTSAALASRPAPGQGAGTVGTAEGAPVQLRVVRVAADVASVRLTTPDGSDAAAPTGGVVALAVPGAATGGTLTALAGDGATLAEVTLPSVATIAGPDCRPQPPQPPAAGEQPADRAGAERQVRAAFRAVFSPPRPNDSYAPMDDIEDGDELRGALDQLRTNFPEAVQTVSVTTGPVVFTDPARAVVRYTLTYTGGAPYGTTNGVAVLKDGRWVVARDTYCSVLSYGGAICPPR